MLSTPCHARPELPKVLSATEPTRCDALLVELPIARGGCSGDSSLELQLQLPGNQGWHKAPGELQLLAPKEDSRRVPVMTIPALDPHSAYKVRLVVHNKKGLQVLKTYLVVCKVAREGGRG